MADILIGLGGTGGKILKAFRQRLWTEFTTAERKKLPISYIYVDTDKALLNNEDVSYQTIHGNCCFEPNDFVDIKSNSDINQIFSNPSGYATLQGILGDVRKTDAAVNPVGAAADQKRRAGRILFAANVNAYLSKLQHAVHQVRPSGECINIYIFAGLAGGTGSGSIVDVVAQTRKWLFTNGLTQDIDYKLVVFCQLPENTPPATWNTGRYKANGYAALLELNSLLTSQYNTQWGTKTNTPPFDSSSQTPMARLYLDFSEQTPENLRAGRIPQSLRVANGLILYSNVNDFGYALTDTSALPTLVADFVYTLVFMPKNDATGELGRFVTFENISNSRSEYDETADPEVDDVMPVRTRAIGTFGIKRVVVPETDIQEHVAYALGLSALSQVLYNNWSSTLGFKNEIGTFDAKSYADDEGRRNNWLMSMAHLMLKKYVLEGDKNENWNEGEYSTYWNPCIDAWAPVARNSEHPFEKLIELCRGGYEKGFRSKGVEQFFNDKATAVEIYTKRIVGACENYLFTEWKEGRLSLYDATKVTSVLIEELRAQIKRITESEVPALEKKIKEHEATINSIITEYLSAPVIKRPFILNNRYQRVVLFAKQLYAAKTELAALRLFTVPLLSAVQAKVEDLNRRTTEFQNRVDDLISFTKERMMVLADFPTDEDEERDGTENLTSPVIKFYNRNRLKQLESKLLHDRQRMEGINSDMRKALVDALQSEDRFANLQRLNTRVLSDALLGKVYERIIAYHSELCHEQNEKVINVPILQRLYEKFGSNETALSEFAHRLIQSSGVFSQIDNNEIMLSNANTDSPVVGQNILLKRIVVLLPKTEDPDLVEFSTALKEKLEGAIPGGTGAAVKVSDEGNNNNEIVVAVMYNGFPMRAISSVVMMRADYDNLIAQDVKNAIVLHTEGVASDYRSLYARKPKTPEELRNDYIPYLFLDLALDKVLKDEDRTGEYGHGTKGLLTTEVTPWGFNKFTELVMSDQVIRERGSLMKRLFSEGIVEALEDVDVEVRADLKKKLDEVEKTMMEKIVAIIKQENPDRATVKAMENWLKKSIEIIRTYQPER